MRPPRLAAREESDVLRRCVEALDPEAPADYRALAALLACKWARSRPRRVGLAGGQGAGKSTLGALIESACSALGLRACVLGLDDFYLGVEARRSLAARIHPLFETRGPPGTHDVAYCREAILALGSPGPVKLPRFDKGLDDRVGTRLVEGPQDIVVLEGWCVGAEAVDEEALEEPINSLERDEDRGGDWRRYVNTQLAGDYRALYRMLDQSVFLQVPNLHAVRRWRGEQERDRPPERRLDAPGIDRFVQHFERVTLSMLACSPGNAEVTVRLAEDHSVAAIQFREGV
ncbi:MAG: kinase [bacterium]|nr:kinase [Deltaproteobacteria bacterium]MCP4906990.1 kinase [bacterium]